MRPLGGIALPSPRARIKIAPPMTAANDTSLPPYPHPRLRMVLLIVALIEALSALSNLTVLYAGAPDIPGTSPGGLLISATILLAPIFAVAAFVFAVRDRIGRAIMALAGLVLLDWLSFLPSVANHWQDFPSPGFGGVVEIVMIVVFPALALMAIYLAWRGERPSLATLLALLPTLFNILGVAVFAIGVAIYGF